MAKTEGVLWEERVKTYHLPCSELNRVIMEYLLKEGFKEAVMAFEEDAHVNPGVNLTVLDDQIKIREAVERGKIQDAIEYVNKVNPTILEDDEKLLFHLKQQQLLELIRDGDLDSALHFAQNELTAGGMENPQFIDELEQTMTLLAFENMQSSPFGQLLQHSQRLKVVSEVNAALLASQNQDANSALSTLMKLVLWSQEHLEKKGINFPRLLSITAGKLQHQVS